jgi:hypothetical protein
MEGGERSTSYTSCFVPGARAAGTHWIGGRVSLIYFWRRERRLAPTRNWTLDCWDWMLVPMLTLLSWFLLSFIYFSLGLSVWCTHWIGVLVGLYFICIVFIGRVMITQLLGLWEETCARLAQSVWWLAMAWTVRRWNPSEGEIFHTRPDQPWVSPSHLYTGYRISFPEVKWPGCGADHPQPSSAKVKEREELSLYSPLWAFVASSRVNFNFCGRKNVTAT